MQTGQEWRTENNNRFFPFQGENDIITQHSGSPTDTIVLPKNFISDIKFFYDRRTLENVYLSFVDFSQDTYTLTFSYIDGEKAISGSIPRLHGKKNVHIFGENNESVVIFSTGPSWTNNEWALNQWPKHINNAIIDRSLVTSGPRLMRRVIIVDSGTVDSLESDWRKETTQRITGSGDISINFFENADSTVANINGSFVEISYKQPGPADNMPCNGDIRTINGVSPNEKGNINIVGLDCIKAHGKPKIVCNETLLEKGYCVHPPHELLRINPAYSRDLLYTECSVDIPDGNSLNVNHALKVTNSCLPCCGCSSYQVISDAITYRASNLKKFCTDMQTYINSSIANHNTAMTYISKAKYPVSKLIVVKVYEKRIQFALQNICILPIYGAYGISISPTALSWTYSGPESVSMASMIALDAPPRYDGPRICDADVPTGTTRKGILGPIEPGEYVEFNLVANTTQDIRTMTIRVEMESNGYYGAQKMIGCVKQKTAIQIKPNTDPIVLPSASCNRSRSNPVYQIINVT